MGFFTLQTAISGSGALTKSGGLVTLTGPPDLPRQYHHPERHLEDQCGFAGLAAGEYQRNAAPLLFSNNGSLAGNIVGSGTLMREFGGATVLTGSTANTIHTVVSSGTLQIGNGGATGDLLRRHQ